MSGDSIVERVQAECEKHFSPIHITVIDESDGCGAKIQLTIVSSVFDGVPLIQRHRKVQSTLKEAGLGMDLIHALTIRAWTEVQWEKKKATSA